MTDINEKYSAQIPNRFWKLNDVLTKKNERLEDLLWVYVYLQNERNYSRSKVDLAVTKISINQMNEEIKIIAEDRSDRNKPRLKKCLNELQELDFLRLDREIKNNSEVFYVEIPLMTKDTSSTLGGYTAITSDTAKLMYDEDFISSSISMQMFAVLCYIIKSQGGKKNGKIPFEELSNVLMKSKKMIAGYINALELRSLIDVRRGSYFFETGIAMLVRQERNVYKVKQKETKEVEPQTPEEQRARQIEKWSNGKSRLDTFDFVYALLNKQDNELIQLVSKRSMSIQKTEQGQKFYLDVMRTANSEIENKGIVYQSVMSYM